MSVDYRACAKAKSITKMSEAAESKSLFQVVDLTADDETCRKFTAATPAFPSGFVKLQPYNQVLPRVFLKDTQQIKDFEVKQDDVWISSFPKCGQ